MILKNIKMVLKKDKKHSYEIHRTLIKLEKLKQRVKNVVLEVKNSLKKI